MQFWYKLGVSKTAQKLGTLWDSLHQDLAFCILFNIKAFITAQLHNLIVYLCQLLGCLLHAISHPAHFKIEQLANKHFVRVLSNLALPPVTIKRVKSFVIAFIQQAVKIFIQKQLDILWILLKVLQRCLHDAADLKIQLSLGFDVVDCFNKLVKDEGLNHPFLVDKVSVKAHSAYARLFYDVCNGYAFKILLFKQWKQRLCNALAHE